MAAVTSGHMAVTAQQDKYIGNKQSVSIYYMAAVTSGRMAVTEQQDKYIINNQCPYIIQLRLLREIFSCRSQARIKEEG